MRTLREVRLDAGLTLTTLAMRARIATSRLSMIERGLVVARVEELGALELELRLRGSSLQLRCLPVHEEPA